MTLLFSASVTLCINIWDCSAFLCEEEKCFKGWSISKIACERCSRMLLTVVLFQGIEVHVWLPLSQKCVSGWSRFMNIRNTELEILDLSTLTETHLRHNCKKGKLRSTWLIRTLYWLCASQELPTLVHGMYLSFPSFTISAGRNCP